MKKQKILIIILFVLFALPIPLSLISWIGTLISVADMGQNNFSSFSKFIQGLIAIITMLLAGTYLASYIISLVATVKNKKITIISFLPVLHIIVFGVFVVVWMFLQ